MVKAMGFRSFLTSTFQARTAVLVIILLTLTPLVEVDGGEEPLAVDGPFRMFANRVVLDTRNGLEWYPGPDRQTSWEQARNWVADLEVAGGGWRMPSKRELRRLFRIADGVSDITPLLYSTGYWVWAGAVRQEADRWLFRFSYGGEGWIGVAPADGGRALAVRRAQ
jgi:hypothetical protein